MDSSPSGEATPEGPTQSRRPRRPVTPTQEMLTVNTTLANGIPSSASGSNHPSPTSPTMKPASVDGNGIPRPPLSADHARSRSWSLGSNGGQPGGFLPYPPYPFPVQGYPPYGPNPYQGFMDPSSVYSQYPNGSTGPSPQNSVRSSASSGPSSNQNNPRRGHKRSHSFGGGSTTSYGSLDFASMSQQYSTRSTGSSSSNNGNFSPRREFMKLAGGGGNGGNNQTPKTQNRRASSHSPTPISPRNSFSELPPMQFSSSMRGSFSMTEDASPRGVIFSRKPSPSYKSSNGGGGGEAVYLAQQKTRKGSSKRQPSTRKMHMRQKSAQLFMEDVKGQEQIPACRDILFLMLFVFHLLGIFYLGRTYGFIEVPDNSSILDDDDEPVAIMYDNVIYIACISGAFAVLISASALFLMMAIAKKIVQVALILTITLSFVWGTIGIGFSPRIVVPASGFVALLLSVAYAFIVWDRIPFVASNLDAGLHGIRANLGLVFLAFIFQALAVGWSVYFTFVVGGVYNALVTGNIDFTIMNGERTKITIFALLALSYYWTMHVISNIVQVTVAGLIGKWWFIPDGDTSTRRSDLNSSFFGAIFYGIGSICYGSLMVGPVRLLRQLSAFFRPSDSSSPLLCLHECVFCIQSCLTSCVDNLSDRYSPWSFTYVGLYGYGLVEGGQNAADLFEKRGWSAIVSDDLAPNVLLMTSLVIGGVTGLFAHLIENIESFALTSLGEPGLVSFSVGLAVGLVASSILFGLITSAVNTVIVCFAASPVDFEENHPRLSNDMRAAWREVWPGCMDVHDMRVAVATYLDPTISERKPLLA